MPERYDRCDNPNALSRELDILQPSKDKTMAYSWELFSNSHPISFSQTSKVISLFSDTTIDHSKRDFRLVAAGDFQKLINNPVTDTESPPHPNNTTWIKVSCAFNGGNMVIAIVYHYIKHQREWSVSVGFDQSLLPAPNPGNAATVKKYSDFAKLLGGQIKLDFGVIGSNIKSFIMIDDVSLAPGTTNETLDGFEDHVTQRTTKIGELIWIAKGGQSVSSGGTYISNGVNSSKWLHAKANNPGIKGYAKTDGGRLCVIKVTWP